MVTQPVYEPIKVLSETAQSPPMLVVPPTTPLSMLYEDPAVPPLLHQILSSLPKWPCDSERVIDDILWSPDEVPPFVGAVLALESYVTYRRYAERIPLEHFLPTIGTNFHALSYLLIPLWNSNRVSAYAQGAFLVPDAIATAAATVCIEDHVVTRARLAISGAWLRQEVRLVNATQQLLGMTLTEEMINEVAHAAAQELAASHESTPEASQHLDVIMTLTQGVLEQCRDTRR